jgi:tripartite-type tricarboxylate transporter receptor subunit TctC
MAGINIVRINYKGAGPALTALIAGELQMMFPTAGAVAPHMRTGRVRVLAVTSAEPTALAPGVPTVAGSGLPGYESISIYGVFAPAHTPRILVDKLNREIVRLLERADIREKFFNAGMETMGGSPEQLAATVKSEIARVGRVIKQAGIRSE